MTTPLLTISERFAGEIWRLEIDSLSGNIFVEIRSREEKRVSFSAFNLPNGTINFGDLTTPERWLTGIEIAYNGVLILHNYQSASSPVHKGIIAIEAVSGENLWSSYTYAFDHLSVNGPIIFNTQIQPKKLALADIASGKIIRPYMADTDQEFLADIVLPQLLPLVNFPQLANLEPYGNMMHYVDYNNFIIVSLHALTAGRLQQHLYVMNNLQVVYEDILNDTIQKIQPEAFILHKDYLIYIKNKSELKVVNL